MKLFSIVCILALVGALVAPLFISVNGKRVMTVDDLVGEDVTAAVTPPTEVYRWQDADGQWHFGEAPPSSGRAEKIAIEDRSTRMDEGWQVGPLDDGPSQPELGMTAPGAAGLVQAGQRLMNDAAVEVEALNQRTRDLDALQRQAN
ncbi:MAG: DUF4124 domain-containing protein [Pseudomonadota bacterium]